MADSRVQFQFQSVSDFIANGWTENFYCGGINATAALVIASNAALVAARRDILSSDFRLSAIRCTTVGSRGDSVGIGYPISQGRGTGSPNATPTGPNQGEQPWDALLMRVKSSTQHVRQFPLRGVPPGVFQDTISLSNQAAGFFAKLNVWINQMIGAHLSSFGLKIRIPSGIPPYPVNVLNFWALQKGVVLTVNNPVPAFLAPRAVVQIKGAVGVNPSVNHVWRVQSLVPAAPPATTTDVFLYRGRRAYAGIATGPITVEPVATSIDPISLMQPQRAMERKTGRPPALLRGRALVRA